MHRTLLGGWDSECSRSDSVWSASPALQICIYIYIYIRKMYVLSEEECFLWEKDLDQECNNFLTLENMKNFNRRCNYVYVISG